MPEKPTTASGYPPGQVARVKSTCLYLATKLGDLMDELVVVGGLVPSLLIDQEKLPENVTPHVGTLDLDLGLAFALVGEQRYQDVVERLRNAKFTADVNEDGKPTRQRWRISDPPVTVDFLIEPETGRRSTGRAFVPAHERLGGHHRARPASGFQEQSSRDAGWKNHCRGNSQAGHSRVRSRGVCGSQGARFPHSRGEQGRLRPVLPASELRARRLGRGRATPSASPGRQRGEGDWNTCRLISTIPRR